MSKKDYYYETDSEDEVYNDTVPLNTKSPSYKVYQAIINNPNISEDVKEDLMGLEERELMLKYDELLTIHERELMRAVGKTNRSYNKMQNKKRASDYKKDIGLIMQSEAKLSKNGKTYTVNTKMKVKKGLHNDIKKLLKNSINNEMKRKLSPGEPEKEAPRTKISAFDVDFYEGGINKTKKYKDKPNVNTPVNFSKKPTWEDFVKHWDKSGMDKFIREQVSKNKAAKAVKENEEKRLSEYYKLPINPKEPRTKADRRRNKIESDYHKSIDGMLANINQHNMGWDARYNY